MLENVVDERALGYPRRDQDGGNTDAEAVEMEGIERAGVVGLGDEAVGQAGWRRHVVEDAAVFVVDDEKGRVGPQIRVLADAVVDSGDELLAGANVVVGVLIAGDEFAGAVGSIVVGVVRLDEAVVGKSVVLAGGEEVLEGSEDRGLVLEEVDDLHRRAGFVVVEELAGVACGEHAVVDCLVLLAFVEDVHADLAERGAVVREGAVADGWTGNGGEPAIEDGELGREGGKDGQLVGGEVVEDVVRVGGILLLVEVALDEALHSGGAAAGRFEDR